MNAIINLKNTVFISVLNEFRNWLKTVGYAEMSVENLPKQVKDFFYFLELNKTVFLQEINNKTLTNYLKYLNERPKHKGYGGLSQSTINAKIKAMKCFSEFLYQKYHFNLPILLKCDSNSINEREILTQNEIKELYKSTNDLRDKAILAIYYGCGLRASEGAALCLQDIQFDKKRIYVACGKGAKERLVPMSKQVIKDLENYIYDKRINQLQNKNYNELFIGRGGKPIKSTGLAKRFKQLCDEANLTKKVSLHCLRHSIATHLLQSGMKLEDVSKFLGHSSLETTQIYTHLINL